MENETEEMQHLKSVLTEKNALIEHLENRNIALTKEKRQAVRAKIKWRENFKAALELLDADQLEELESIIGAEFMNIEDQETK